MSDVFVRQGRDPLQLVSVGFGGVPANGPSYDPDISADGTRVVFVSEADNLVAGDSNKQPDVFVADLRTGVISLISKNNGDGPANGRSMLPAISANGRYVTFTSGASNIVEKDTNGVTDVFLRDLQRELTERVSVSNAGRQQRTSVAPPFLQISDVSERRPLRGVRLGRRQPHARRHQPPHRRLPARSRPRHDELVSASSINVQGNNDSFAPRLSADGRLLTFESFATNLAPGDGPREDIFMRDLAPGHDERRQRHRVRPAARARAGAAAPAAPGAVERRQRRRVQLDGRRTSSTATATAPRTSSSAAPTRPGARSCPSRASSAGARSASRPTIRRRRRFVCRYDSKPAFRCGATIKVPRGAGRRLFVRAGGPGHAVRR